MKVAFGLKAHSGWAALVVLGTDDGDPVVVDRRRLELIEKPGDAWAKQPYHAAEELAKDEARDLVRRGIEAARRSATREMRAAVMRARQAGQVVAGCAVLTGEPMPGWSVDEILAVHFRMHKAEGVLFREALVRAAGDCELNLVEIPGKRLKEHAERALAVPMAVLQKRVVALGRSAGPPWGKDQKEAAIAALVALRGRPARTGR